MSAPVSEISALPNLTLVSIAGNDTPEVLQGLLSHDIRVLSRARGLLAGDNASQGHVCAFSSALEPRQGVFALVPTQLLSDRLQRRSRCVLREAIAWNDADERLKIAEVSPDDLTTLALMTHLGTAGAREQRLLLGPCRQRSRTQKTLATPHVPLRALGSSAACAYARIGRSRPGRCSGRRRSLRRDHVRIAGSGGSGCFPARCSATVRRHNTHFLLPWSCRM